MKVLADGETMTFVTSNQMLAESVPGAECVGFSNLGLHAAPFDPTAVEDGLLNLGFGERRAGLVIVDMSWGWETPAASANFDIWGSLCGKLAARGMRIVSVYDWHMLIGDQMLAALRGHRSFLSPSGLRENPFWLPPDYLSSATLREQVSFLLGRVVPDWADMTLAPASGEDAALGADPGWLSAGGVRPMEGLGRRWKIRCFGRLRVYTSAAEQIDWAPAGGAPRKTKALFAYLLQRGESGATAERIAELLWPDEADEAVKRSRLHHAVAMLRRVLGGKQFVVRRGDYYYLEAPPGTWVDIKTFEQFCRRAKALEKAGRNDAALSMLQAAERLYTGDLFEDILPEYVESEAEDWCLPQRIWFKDMALKVQRDMASILRREGRLRDALKHCRRALEMDPACEIVHAEAMRIFHAQNRREAMTRQYRQYLEALRSVGADTRHPPLKHVFEALSSGI